MIWAWGERVYLKARFSKYFNLPGEPKKFDGPALKQLIDEYEPIVWSVVSGGSSIAGAVMKVIATKLAPHKMTKKEEKIFHDNASGGQTPGNF